MIGWDCFFCVKLRGTHTEQKFCHNYVDYWYLSKQIIIFARYILSQRHLLKWQYKCANARDTEVTLWNDRDNCIFRSHCPAQGIGVNYSLSFQLNPWWPWCIHRECGLRVKSEALYILKMPWSVQVEQICLQLLFHIIMTACKQENPFARFKDLFSCTVRIKYIHENILYQVPMISTVLLFDWVSDRVSPENLQHFILNQTNPFLFFFSLSPLVNLVERWACNMMLWLHNEWSQYELCLAHTIRQVNDLGVPDTLWWVWNTRDSQWWSI